jgi:hypothetical protein
MLTRPNHVARWRFRYKMGIFLALYALTIVGLREASLWDRQYQVFDSPKVTEKVEPVERPGAGQGSHASPSIVQYRGVYPDKPTILYNGGDDLIELQGGRILAPGSSVYVIHGILTGPTL